MRRLGRLTECEARRRSVADEVAVAHDRSELRRHGGRSVVAARLAGVALIDEGAVVRHRLRGGELDAVRVRRSVDVAELVRERHERPVAVVEDRCRGLVVRVRVRIGNGFGR